MRTDDEMLAHHLQFNHMPPVAAQMVPYCQIAIERAEAGDWDSTITIKGDGGEMTVTVTEIVDDLHLHDFVAAHAEEEA